jgi:hypothetical protein
VVDEFHTWLFDVFKPIFLEAIPDIPPSFGPAKLATGEARPLLSEYFFPEDYRSRVEGRTTSPFPSSCETRRAPGFRP